VNCFRSWTSPYFTFTLLIQRFVFPVFAIICELLVFFQLIGRVGKQNIFLNVSLSKKESLVLSCSFLTPAPMKSLLIAFHSWMGRAVAQAVMWDFVMDKSVAGEGFRRELRFPLSIYIPSASPHSSSLSPEAGTIGQNWPHCQYPTNQNNNSFVNLTFTSSFLVKFSSHFLGSIIYLATIFSK
jgi:hypothetical protein